jgi:hypothetical protein
MSYVYKMENGKLTKKNVVRKPFNPRAYAMAREEAYMQASCYHPDRREQQKRAEEKKRKEQWWLYLPKPMPVERGW